MGCLTFKRCENSPFSSLHAQFVWTVESIDDAACIYIYIYTHTYMYTVKYPRFFFFSNDGTFKKISLMNTVSGGLCCKWLLRVIFQFDHELGRDQTAVVLCSYSIYASVFVRLDIHIMKDSMRSKRFFLRSGQSSLVNLNSSLQIISHFFPVLILLLCAWPDHSHTNDRSEVDATLLTTEL